MQQVLIFNGCVIIALLSENVVSKKLFHSDDFIIAEYGDIFSFILLIESLEFDFISEPLIFGGGIDWEFDLDLLLVQERAWNYEEQTINILPLSV